MKYKPSRYGMALLAALLLLSVIGFSGCRSREAAAPAPPASEATPAAPAPPASQPTSSASAPTAPKVYESVADRYPPPLEQPIEQLNALPPTPANHKSAFAVDFRNRDLSGLDLSASAPLLMEFATFSTDTIWPGHLPTGFGPDRSLTLGKDPGLGIRALHAQGVTGKGIKVAILDMTLLRDHEEYADRVVRYTEVGEVASPGLMHGGAVTSILAGRTIGVAPGVDVIYYATQFAKNETSDERTFLPMAQVLNQIMDENQKLPRSEQVRVISVSIAAGANEEGAAEVSKAYQRAIAEGVLVVTVDMPGRRYWIQGLGRDPYRDPNDYRSYGPGHLWATSFYTRGPFPGKPIYVPMDSRTTASPTSTNGYTFYRDGGMSWSVPYAAGVYALVLGVNPDVTPEQFLQTAYETGDWTTVTHGGKEYKLGPILNPKALIEKLRR